MNKIFFSEIHLNFKAIIKKMIYTESLPAMWRTTYCRYFLTINDYQKGWFIKPGHPTVLSGFEFMFQRNSSTLNIKAIEHIADTHLIIFQWI